MYVRRKVFSLLEDSETGEEKYFSTTDVTLEELEQREFGNKENKIKRRIWERKQAAIAGTIAALPIGGAYVSGKIAIRKWNEKRKKNK